MAVLYAIRLFIRPRAAWRGLRETSWAWPQVLVRHTLPFALIPAVSGYIGTTKVGWSFGIGEPMRLTESSALSIAVLYYFAMIAATLSVGWAIKWMAHTYGSRQDLGRCVALASFTATPLFVIGLMQLYPLLWLNLVVGLPALAYTSFVFFSGVPIMMEISEERGFLFSSAILAFGLVTLVAMLAVTVLLWGAGFAPQIAS
ncbi:MAG: Yip1 family protein [Gammaproteobacteria bacterium]